MRSSEFMGLNQDSFDYEHSIIKIEHAADIRGKIVPVKTKTSVRSIPMPRSIMERVKAFSAHLYTKPKTNYFLVSVNELRRKMQAWSKKAGLKYILLHGLRHSHASYLINLGVPITAISHRLGHTNAQITLSTYSHLYKEDETSIADLLEKNI
jgi:integrase